ncbi:MarR family transcriptional regulator [Oceanispirochaeta sp.]|jgi:DNA-binding MarR family transcriptional regulator|uniref:MarR family winged helix-turn-helix transcriptional regulator n=1 Tax=Oceanispirochaeta sp. TaxID=2035350 RepID=UPI00260C3ACE|nr:MarR family transcriptional regulator [Oceanispirochaeta sp.]MDA3957667.1 MarR family transcriptional regulator [Oceanispirochaeta sp.]
MTEDDVFQRVAAFISNIHTLESDLAQLIQDNELTSLQQDLLRILYFSGPRNLSSLSTCMNMNLPNSSREVKRLSEAGLILKENSLLDKRVTELSLSDSGRRKVEEGLEKMKASLFSSSGEWTTRRVERVLASLTILEEELFPPHT